MWETVYETGFFLCSPVYPRTRPVDQVGLELLEIHLSLPLTAEIKGVSTTKQLLFFLSKVCFYLPIVFNKLKMCLPGIGMVRTPVRVSDGQT